MPGANDSTSNPTDPFDLSRFVSAQGKVYATVLAELRSGQKRTHWMWFIFPQCDGLGSSATAQYYAIKSKEEAQHYLSHPILGARLVECAETVLAIKGHSASAIFGYPDDMKLQSSMTLFAALSEAESAFAQVLQTYFSGKQDSKTLRFLEQSNRS